jgi:HEAT repeat protein
MSLIKYDGPAGPYYKSCGERTKVQILGSQLRVDAGELAGSWDPPGTMVLSAVAPPKSVPPELRQRAEALIEELADEEWTVRERATAELLRLGPEALPLILEATFNPDPEVVHRATHVAQELAAPGGDDQRIETTSLNIWSMQLTYIRSPAVFAPR